MKLKRFKEENLKIKIMLIGSIVFILLLTIIFLYRSFALYEEKEEFNVIKGSIPEQNYDLMLSLTREDKEQNKTTIDQVPEKNENQKYEVEVNCNNDAIGSWNYQEWKPEITNFNITRTKCSINFKENNEFVYPVVENIEEGKQAIANAITQKGVNTSAEATLNQMANNIKNIKTTPNIGMNGWGISVFGSSYSYGQQISKSYNLSNGHYYVLVFRLQSSNKGCGWSSGDYAAGNITLSGGTLMKKFTLGQGNANYAGLIFLAFRATSNTVTVNGIRFSNSGCADARWYLSDAIIDIYTY